MEGVEDDYGRREGGLRGKEELRRGCMMTWRP